MKAGTHRAPQFAPRSISVQQIIDSLFYLFRTFGNFLKILLEIVHCVKTLSVLFAGIDRNGPCIRKRAAQNFWYYIGFYTY